MSTLGGIMDTSLGAMFAARVALATVGHNIANVNTEGFSRQEAVIVSRRPLLATYGALGRGVGVETVRRLTDDFLLRNLRLQAARQGGYAQVDAALQEIEGIMGSVQNDHLGAALGRFFAAWEDLATPPSDPAHKAAVASAARALVADLHATRNNLDDLARTLDRSLQDEVAGLNDLLSQVAQLNEQVLAAEMGGQSGNDLRDKRDLLVGRISAAVRCEAVEREDGTVDVIVSGRTLVTRDRFQPLELEWSRTVEPHLSVVTSDTRIEIAVPEGRLQGLFAARDEQVGDVRARLDALAAEVIAQVNALHVQGRSEAGTGQLFFVGEDAATIELAPELAARSELIATSRSGIAGDNDLALAIAGLGEEDGESLPDVYRELLGEVAARRGRFQFLLESQQDMVAAIESRLASARGVSLDEEGASLVMYQQSFDAAARVITTVQEMYETLLDM